VLLDLLAAHGYTARFARTHGEPPPAFGLTTELQRRTWQRLVAHGGRPVATGALAASLGVSREHLSRAFAAGGAPNLKRTIDYVRLLTAATLAKSPALDLRDVARVAGFAGVPQLEAAAQRVLGVGGASLARLRPQDLAGRFVQGHARLHPVEARSRAG
jgi:transcriptional regulator GlxA family with amidase domain